jgi:hypothetical protein
MRAAQIAGSSQGNEQAEQDEGIYRPADTGIHSDVVLRACTNSILR